ncbi:hypothetical protein Tco_1395873 [Tanacetum coccineum]
MKKDTTSQQFVPVNIQRQLSSEFKPVKSGPKPALKVPSIIAVTVANARESPLRELCVPDLRGDADC